MDYFKNEAYYKKLKRLFISILVILILTGIGIYKVAKEKEKQVYQDEQAEIYQDVKPYNSTF
jgi:hypothetical protein